MDWSSSERRDADLSDRDAHEQHADHGAELDAADAQPAEGITQRQRQEERELRMRPQRVDQPVQVRLLLASSSRNVLRAGAS